QDAERLKKRHHWFAEVALSRGLPESDPARVEIIKTGTRTVIVMISAVVIAGLAMMVGFVLATIGVIMLVSRSLRPAYACDAALAGTTTGQRAALLESLVLFILALLGLSAVAEGIQAAGGPDLKVWLLWLALAAAWWPRVWGMERSAWKTALGWHAGRGVLREIGAGIVGYLAGLPIVLVGLVTTVVLIAVTGSKPTHPAVEQVSAGGGWWASAQLMVLACLWAPVCEETFFRGAMFAHCRRWLHPLLSALIVAFVFAAIHPQGWTVVPALMSLAVSFALVREWRGSIIASMTGHAIQNGFVMTLNLLMLGG
ncbi:MAG: CPBP family intramembrane glutamic endopeptidase, partial [Alsobacter sp.]